MMLEILHLIKNKIWREGKNIPGMSSGMPSKSLGDITVEQPLNFSISLNSLIVKATCIGPLLPITITFLILLFNKQSIACWAMSVS